MTILRLKIFKNKLLENVHVASTFKKSFLQFVRSEETENYL